MRKIVSSVLAFVMVCASVATSFAAPMQPTREQFLEYVGFSSTSEAFREVYEYPEANISLQRNAAGAYDTTDLIDYVAVGATMPLYDIKADFDMSVVKDFFTSSGAFSAEKIALLAGKTRGEVDTYMNDIQVSGSLEVMIVYPSSLLIPAEFLNADYTNPAENMKGFCDNAKRMFVETDQRTVTAVDATNSKLTITIGVRSEFDTYAELLAEANSTSEPNGFNNLALTCEGVQPTAYGTYAIKGFVDGDFKIGDPYAPISTIRYKAIQEGTPVENETPVAERKITVLAPSVSGGGGSAVAKAPEVNFYIYGEKFDVEVTKGNGKTTVDIDKVIPPEKEGMTFDGWYTDETFTSKLTGEQTFTVDTNLYAKYVVTSAPSVFEDGYHKEYIHGYPDGTVQPNGMITREEVVTALYRLLKDEVRAEITTTENTFPDVAEDRWSNTEVSSIANGGYVNGYEDGTFRPANAITRAEFAAIMLRFFAEDDSADTVNPYTDITGHWAESAIVSAYSKNLFVGYPDGTFKPDAYITRAEAMTVINRITVRKPHIEGFVEGYIDWPDISENDWYYNDVIEATNSHDYIRIDDLMTENWTELKN